jgi:hypothetical protein
MSFTAWREADHHIRAFDRLVLDAARGGRLRRDRRRATARPSVPRPGDDRDGRFGRCSACGAPSVASQAAPPRRCCGDEWGGRDCRVTGSATTTSGSRPWRARPPNSVLATDCRAADETKRAHPCATGAARHLRVVRTPDICRSGVATCANVGDPGNSGEFAVRSFRTVPTGTRRRDHGRDPGRSKRRPTPTTVSAQRWTVRKRRLNAWPCLSRHGDEA